LELEGSYEELFERAASAVLPHRPDEAIVLFRKLFDRLAAMSPELRSKGAGLDRIMVSAGGQLVSLYRWKGNFDSSIEMLDRMTTLAPVLKDSWALERAMTLIDSGGVEKGLDILRGLTMQHPEDRMLRLTAAQELMQHGQPAEAERALKRVAQDKSHKDEALKANIMLLNLQMANGGPSDVTAAWNRAVSFASTVKSAAPAVYDWFLLRGALDALEGLLKDDGNSFRVNLYLGRIAAARGDQPEAEKRWLKVVEDKPAGEWADVQSWIEAELHLGRNAEALSLLGEALSRDLGGERSMVLYIVATVRIGEIDNAMKGLVVAAGSQIRFRPRRTVLDDGNWWLVQQYITDTEQLNRMRPYFDVPQAAPSDAPAATPEAPATES
jgi:predicted Zn-dependent protease